MSKNGLVLLLSLLLGAAPSNAANPHQNLLKGNVQKSDQRFRVQRPQTPASVKTLTAAATKDGAKSVRDNKPQAIFDSNADFLFNPRAQTPTEAPFTPGSSERAKRAQTELDIMKAEAENSELVIAWEAWYKRVASEVFSRWVRNSGHIPAHCDVAMTFYRNGTIKVNIDNLSLLDEHRMAPYEAEALQRTYRASIEDSIIPLEHTFVVQFPEKSRRQSVTWPTHFNVVTGGVPGYEWVKNDYERVPSQ